MSDHVYPPARNRLSVLCSRIVQATSFQTVSMGVVLLNAVVLGLHTYDSVTDRVGGLLTFLDEVCLSFFMAEVVIGIVAFGGRPWRYFRHGWNVFDFMVVAGAFVPGVRENVTLLRLLRLARVVRLVKLFPSLRILLLTVWRAIPKSASLLLITIVIIYLYGMLGWILFSDEYPERFGTIGEAALTLFILLTLDDLGNTIRDGEEVSSWLLPYYLGFVMFGAFVLINILIGVVIASMDEAKEITGAEAVDDVPDPASDAGTGDTAEILARLDALQRTVAELRGELAAERASPDTEPPERQMAATQN